MNIDWHTIVYSIPAVIIGLTVHEYFHAFTADKLGDPTAKELGRITLNPLKHIDILGMIFIIIAGFGWAKPVQFNLENLKKPRLYKALIALAGPLSNLVLGLAALFLVKAYIPFSWAVSANVHSVIVHIFIYLGMINLGLFFFNILPLPPLDGSHVFFSGLNLPVETELKIMKYGSYVLFFIIIVQSRTNLDLIPISKITNYIAKLFFN